MTDVTWYETANKFQPDLCINWIMRAIRTLKRHNRTILVVILALVILGPVFYYFRPYLNYSPDILYVKAKILQILQGGMFEDPITGYDTFHPPVYHLFLTPLAGIGLSLETILTLITISNLSLTFFFVYKVVQEAFDSTTSFYTCLMTPFILSCMGSGEILLASSFYFSMPFYLAGLWLYIRRDDSKPLTIAASALWGIAFLISPVYVFLLGLTFIYDLLLLKRPRRFLIMIVTFLITITPFIIQGVYIFSQDLWGTSVFSIWRGFPDLQWWRSLVVRFIAPSIGRFETTSAILHALILAAATSIIVIKRKTSWFIPVALIAYFLTFYHFSWQYAMRIQIFLSVFLVAMVIHFFATKLNKKAFLALILSPFIIFSVFKHYSVAVPTYRVGEENRANLMRAGEKLFQVMDRYLVEDRYLFCSKDTYRKYILGRFPAHSLGAWQTMDYYQLSNRFSESLEADYQAAFNSNDYESIEGIADKYRINRALISGDDEDLPFAKILLERWQLIYIDKYFCILSRPN